MVKKNPRVSVLAILITLSILRAGWSAPVALSAAAYTTKSTGDSGPNFFIARGTNFVSTSFDSSSSTWKEVLYTNADANLAYKASSANKKCALLYLTTSGSEKLNVVDFSPATTAVLKKQLIAGNTPTTPLVMVTNAITANNDFGVSNDCGKVRIGSQVLAYVTADYVSAPLYGTANNIVYSADYLYGVANQGIFKYSSVSNSYSLVKAATFKKNKVIWTTSNGIIVFSYSDVSGGNVDYDLTAFTIQDPTYTEITTAKMSGTTATQAPKIVVSQAVDIVVIWGDEGGNFKVQGRKIHFAQKVAVTLVFPALMTATKSDIAVSSRFIYAKNIVNNANTKKMQGGYFINGKTLTTYYEREVTNTTYTDSTTRSFIASTSQDPFRVMHETGATDAKSVSVQDVTLATADQMLLVGESLERPKYLKFSRKKVSSKFPLTVVDYDPRYTSNKSESKLQLTTRQFQFKAYSANLTCVLIYGFQTGSQTIQMKNFQESTVVDKPNIPLTLVPIADITSSSKFQISNDCNAFRKDNVVYHYQTADSKYVADTVPGSLTNPVYSSDFKYIVVDANIYAYDATTKIYTATSIVGPFKKNKKIWTTTNGVIVFSWTDADVTTKIMDYEVRAYSLLNSIYTQIPTSAALMVGKSYQNAPSISVSENSDIVVVYGKDQSQVYFKKASRIHFKQNAAVDLVLPDLMNTESYIVASSRYIYARNTVNKASTTLKYHGGYFINSKTLTTYFEEAIVPAATLQQSFVTNSSISALIVVEEWQPTNGVEGVQTFKAYDYPLKQNKLILQHYNRAKYLVYSNKPATSQYKYSVSNFRRTAALDQEEAKVQFALASQDYEYQAISRNLNCALLYRYQTNQQQLLIVQYDATATVKADILAKIPIADIHSTTKFEISDDCKTIKKDNVVYVSTDGTTFGADVGITSTKNPTYSSSFLFAAASDGLYKYASGAYTSAISTTFKKNKNIYESPTGIIVFSWDDVSSQKVVYNIQAFSISSGTLTAIPLATIDGTSDDKAPQITVSQSADIVIIYRKQSGTITTTGKKIHFKYNTAVDLDLSVIMTGDNYISASSRYIYARNKVVTAASKHEIYSINSKKVTKYIDSTIGTAQLGANWKRAFLQGDGTASILLYFEQQSEGATGSVNTITNKKYALNESYLLLQSGINKANYFMLQNKASISKYTYRALSFASTYPSTFVTGGSFAPVNYVYSVPDTLIKATSENLNCAMIYRFDNGNEEFSIIDYSSGTATAKKNLLAAPLSLAIPDVISKTLQISNDCKAFIFGDKTYHTADFTTVSADTVPAWTSPVFSSDFKFAADINGVYQYVSTSYTKVNQITGTFKKNIKIWATTSALVVFSWSDEAANGDVQYDLQVFTLPTITKVTQISGISNKAPQLGISPNLQTIIINGQATVSTATTFLPTGRKLNYVNGTSTTLALPSLLNDTKSIISVTNRYIYARNLVTKTGTTDKYHGAYFVYNNQMIKYFQQILPTTTITTTWSRSFLEGSDRNEILIRNEYVTKDPTNTTIEVEEKLRELEKQVFKWNFEKDGTLVTKQEVAFGFTWFIKQQLTTPANTNQFQTLSFNQLAVSQSSNKNSRANTFTQKAVSSSKRCVLYFDSASQKLMVYDLVAKLEYDQLSVVKPALYSGIDLTTATFSISDSCYDLRINNNIYHVNPITLELTQDTQPIATLSNPVFAADFSLLITDNEILIYVPKTPSAASGRYVLDRNETFYSKKNIWKYGNYFVVFTQKESSTAGVWIFKVQVNIVVGTVSKKIGEFIGNTSGQSTIAVSPRLTKIIVSGKSTANSTKPYYFAQTINYPGENVKNITIPSALTDQFHKLSLSDEYLYVRSLSDNITQRGYIIMQTLLYEAFNQVLSSPYVLDYSRSVIIPDSVNKLVLYHQFNSGNWIYLVKEERLSSSQMLNTNQGQIYEMSYQVYNSFFSNIFGKYIGEIQTTKVGQQFRFYYAQYNSSIFPTKMKKYNATKSSANIQKVVGASPNMSCMVTVTALTLNVYKINSTTTDVSLSTPVNIYPVVLSGGFTKDQIQGTTLASGNVVVGVDCGLIKFKNALFISDATNTYKKSVTAVDWVNPVFDASLKFVLTANKVYKYVTSDYSKTQLFTVSGLMTSHSLYVSPDETKIVILSSTQTGSNFTAMATMFVFDNNTWSQIELNKTIAASPARPKVLFAPNFTTIGIQSVDGPSDAQKTFAYFFSINITAKNKTSFTSPSEFRTDYLNSKELQFTIVQKYLHLINPSTGFQYIYAINATNLTFNLTDKRTQTLYEQANIKRVNITEQNSKFYILYEMVFSNNLIWLVKRQFANSSMADDLSKFRTDVSKVFINGTSIFSCPVGCQQCWNANHCMKCYPGFVLNSYFTCVRCGSLCKTCALNDIQTCLTLFDGYFIANSGKIDRCHESCQSCASNGPSDCLSCQVGFYSKVTPGACQPCIDNCIDCTAPVSDASPKCNTCEVGFVYHPIRKICVNCLTGCTTCNYDKVQECLSCALGFEAVYQEIVNNATNNTTNVTKLLKECTLCPQNCTTCAQGKCLTCINNFRLQNDACVAMCNLPCKNCTSNDTSRCQSCINGYILNGTQCIADLNCSISKNCTTCPVGYNYVLGECLVCDGGLNCKTCSATNIKKCASCVTGYFLTVGSTCSACNITGCVDCATEMFCRECKPGFTLSGNQAQSKCIKCNPQCATCRVSPSNCYSCAPGYALMGWACVDNYVVSLSLQLQGNFSAMTTTDYSKIVDSLASILNCKKNDIVTNSLRQGSIRIDLTVNAFNSTQQQVMMSQIQTSASTGVAIGGFPITSLSVAAKVNYLPPFVDNTNSQAQYYKKVAIIVGIVIPTGLIIIFAILWVLKNYGLLFFRGPVKIVSSDSFDQMKESDKIRLGNSDEKANTIKKGTLQVSVMGLN